MSARPLNPRRSADASNAALPRPITWAKSLWNRSSNQPVEPDDATKLLTEMRDELRVRLLVHDKAALVARNLFIVHKAMGQNGWISCAGLPLHVLAGACSDAEELQRQEPTPLMALFLDRLIEVRESAAQMVAEEHAAGEARAWALTDCPEVPEVSEASHEDYEQMERSWIGTVPSGLRGADRERRHVMAYSGIPIENAAPAAAPEGGEVDGASPGEGDSSPVVPLGTFKLHSEAAPAPPAMAAAPAAPIVSAAAFVDPPVATAASSKADSGPTGVDVFVAIERLAALHAKGILTEAEFAAKKSELLSRV